MTDTHAESIKLDADSRDSSGSSDSGSSNVVAVNRTSSVSAPNSNAAELSGEGGALISMIERASRDPSVDIDKFERLLKMQQLVASQANERAFNAAIALAKGQIGPIFKNKTVDFMSAKGRTNYRYEDLSEVARTIDPVLSRNGLSYRYRTTQEGGKLTVSCILTHVDGHSETTTLAAQSDQSGNKNDIQAIGSSATYLQRYTLKLALGLSASVDDDGKAASAPVTISEEQEAELRKLIDETDTHIPAFCEYFRIEKLPDLKVTAFNEAKAALKKKAKTNA